MGIGDSGMGECDWGAFEGELWVTVVMVVYTQGKNGGEGMTRLTTRFVIKRGMGWAWLGFGAYGLETVWKGVGEGLLI